MIKRYINPLDRKYLDLTYKDIINVKNITYLTKWKINKIFQKEEAQLKEKLLHNIIDEYLTKIKNITLEDVNRVNHIIKKCGITLNEIEQHNLLLLEERVFSLDRHIKIIEVDFPLLKKEKVGMKFTNAKLFILQDQKWSLLDKGDFYLSNKRLIFMSSNQEFLINNDQLSDLDYQDSLSFVFDNNHYKIDIHDKKTLRNTLTNFYNL